MTERQAWLELAKAWDSPNETTIHGGKQLAFIKYRGVEPCGLCPCIEAMADDGVIDADTSVDMEARIPTKRQNNYAWPPTLAGAKKRAAFCRRMAAKLAKPKRKAGKHEKAKAR